MKPWLAAYLGAHITATIAVLTAWNYYLATSKLHPTRPGRSLWRFVAVVLTPVFFVATMASLGSQSFLRDLGQGCQERFSGEQK